MRESPGEFQKRRESETINSWRQHRLHPGLCNPRGPEPPFIGLTAGKNQMSHEAKKTTVMMSVMSLPRFRYSSRVGRKLIW